MYRIFVINTGSTSTKIAIFEGNQKSLEESITHSVEDLKDCKDLMDQYPIRYKAIKDFLDRIGAKADRFDAIAARGGTFGYAEGGAYRADIPLQITRQTFQRLSQQTLQKNAVAKRIFMMPFVSMK